MEIIKVKDVAHLRELVASGKHRFFIQLNLGLRSSKFITGNGDKFCIFNEIDGSEDRLTEEELFDKSLTNVGEAIKYGAFFCKF